METSIATNNNSNSGKKKILIVEDHEALRNSLQDFLFTLYPKFLIHSASTGEEGVSIANCIRPDIVLMDVKLPGIDGFEATRLIKQNNNGTKIIIVTILEGVKYENDSYDAGASAFINKKDLEKNLSVTLAQILKSRQET